MATLKTGNSKASIGQGQNCAVINPHALADLVSGQSIPWNDIPDTEPTSSVLDATVSVCDVSWWRPTALTDNEGVFAVEGGAFEKYFAGFGTAH